MAESSALDLIFTIISFFNILAFAGFILKAVLPKNERNYGLLMIIILNLSYFIWAIINVLAVYFAKSGFIFPLYYGISTFSLCWSAAFAIFTNSVIKSTKLFNFKKFMISSFIACSTVSSIFPIILITHSFGAKVIYNDESLLFSVQFNFKSTFERLLYLLLNDGITKILPVYITSHQYYKVYKALARLQKLYANFKQPKKMFYFVLLPIICFVPALLSDIMAVFDLEGDSIVNFIEFFKLILYHCWGLLNLWSFWFLKPAEKKKKIRSESQNRTTSQMLSQEVSMWVPGTSFLEQDSNQKLLTDTTTKSIP